MSEVNFKRHERRQEQRKWQGQQKQQGKSYTTSFTLPNRKSALKTVAEEQQMMQTTTEEKLKVYLHLLPGLLHRLHKIPDPRQPKKIKHSMTVLMIYGIFMFVFQMASRRETNREMTTPQLLENVRAVFPELMDMPHQDTLCRLLEEIDVDQIEMQYVDLLRRLIRKKTFQHLLHRKRYLVAIDGTQKYVMNQCWDERYLRRKIKGKDGEYQYYAYVLEAVFVFSNGMVLPLMSEFLENTPELEAAETEEQWKQDCELKAFHRLARRIKKQFPQLPITLLLDGLYANGPVMEACRKNKWESMIVLKSGSLPTVWREVEGLLALNTQQEQSYERTWQGREQHFRWVNEIEYVYGSKKSNVQTIHVVLCEESWDTVTPEGEWATQTSRHAWISSVPINGKNVHERCNLAARKRWLHENNILKEKHHGYLYEHRFSHDWNAMQGYHYLMHIARMLNELALHALALIHQVKEMGIRATLRQFRIAMSHYPLDQGRLRCLAASSHQLRLIWEEDWKVNKQVA